MDEANPKMVRIVPAIAYLLDRDKGLVNIRFGDASVRVKMTTDEIDDLTEQSYGNPRINISHVIVSPTWIQESKHPHGYAAISRRKAVGHAGRMEAVCFLMLPQRFDGELLGAFHYMYERPSLNHNKPSIETIQKLNQHGMILDNNFIAWTLDDAVLATLIA